jgi:SAM-dependent methyltransferase
MSQDPYADFAERHDRFWGKFGEHDPAIVAFYRRLCTEHGVRRVLDCACGTGRHLALFHALGCQVTGSDLSPSMLDRARRNLVGQGIEVPLVRADYRELARHFETPFDAVVCLSSSILHAPDEEQVLRALQSMHGALRAQGVLVLTQGTSDRQWAARPRFIPAINEPDFTRLFVIDYLGRGARYNILDIHHSEKRRDLEVWSVEYAQMLLRDDYQRLLKAAGFQHIHFYGSYEWEPYDKETSDRLLVVAET